MATTGVKGVSKDKKQPRFWTPQEDDYLRQAIKKYGVDGYEAWKQVAADVPERSYRECMQRWTKVLTPGLRKGKWDPDEDRELTQLVKKQLQLLGEGNKKRIVWSQISKSFGGRSCKQCRERWINHLDPTVKKTEWTEVEDSNLLSLARLYPHKWAKIAREIPGRTENMVKVRWNALNRMKQKEDANKSKRKADKKGGNKQTPSSIKPAIATKLEYPSMSQVKAEGYDYVETEPAPRRNTFLDAINNMEAMLTSNRGSHESTRRPSTVSIRSQNGHIWNESPLLYDVDPLAGPMQQHKGQGMTKTGLQGTTGTPTKTAMKSESLSSWPRARGRRGRPEMSQSKEDMFETEELDNFLFSEEPGTGIFPPSQNRRPSLRKLSTFSSGSRSNEPFQGLPNLNKIVGTLNGDYGESVQYDPQHNAQWADGEESDVKREREASRRASLMLWANDAKKSKNGRRRSSVLRTVPNIEASDELPGFNHEILGNEFGGKDRLKEGVDTDGSIRRMSNKLSQLFLLESLDSDSGIQTM